MARRHRRQTPRKAVPRNTAFINVPYDRQYEDLYLAFIAGLSGFGLIPRATVEIPGSQRRLDRIVGLLRRCRYSFRDLSRVEVDRTPPPMPRFNMPFELGLAVALEKTSRKHEWFVFEARAHRAAKSLSDLAGTDVYIHRGTGRGVLVGLANALARHRHRPTVRELEQIHQDLRTAARTIGRGLRASSLFDARPFKDLALAARISARKRIASLRKRRFRNGRSPRRLR